VPSPEFRYEVLLRPMAEIRAELSRQPVKIRLSLGMEAVCRIDVVDFPAFIVVDDKGNDFFADVTKPMAMSIPLRPGL
jgi:tartrate dehydratase beta subunit/fumarate hydratase class I family protein